MTFRIGSGGSPASNIIIRNLKISEPIEWEQDEDGNRIRVGDAIAITNSSHNIWIDHCEFWDAPDSAVDITTGSDFVTVSWNVIRDNHRTGLAGRDGEPLDPGKISVTYHHNWFQGINTRNPRVSHGKVHIFNNLYDGIGTGVLVATDARIFFEGNYFEPNVRGNAWDIPSNVLPDQPGHVELVDNYLLALPRWTPPSPPPEKEWHPANEYIYQPNNILNVPALVRAHAGVGKIDTPPLDP